MNVNRWVVEGLLAIILPLMGWVGAAYVKFAPIESKIAVLESRQRAIDEKLKEMRDDIKELLRR